LNWLIVTVVLLVAFGPVLWLVPSRRDRALARMRTRARTLGVTVELVALPDPDPTPQARVSAGGRPRHPTIAGVAYRYPLARATPLAPAWSIVRGPSSGPGAMPGWQWTGAAAGLPGYWQEAAAILARVPGDVFAAEVDPGRVTLFWRERVGDQEPEEAVESLVNVLRALAELQQAHHVARETELERQRSDDEGAADRPS
jgi:hypothetical protein